MRTRRRRRSTALSVAALLAVAGTAVAVYFQPQKLFLDDTVREPFPVTVAAPQGSAAAPPVDRPAQGPVVLSSGRFQDRGHAADGAAGVVLLPDAVRVLRLEALDVSNGPDLRVLLSRHAADADNDVIADDGLDLGALKGNRGDQTYAIPSQADLDDFRSVIVWCRRFSYVFAAAPLTPHRPMS